MTTTAVALPSQLAPARWHSATAAAPAAHAAPTRPPLAAAATAAEPPFSHARSAGTAASFLENARSAALFSANHPSSPAAAPPSDASTKHTRRSLAPLALARASSAAGARLHSGTPSCVAAVSLGSDPTFAPDSAAARVLRSVEPGRCCGAAAPSRRISTPAPPACPINAWISFESSRRHATRANATSGRNA